MVENEDEAQPYNDSENLIQMKINQTKVWQVEHTLKDFFK